MSKAIRDSISEAFGFEPVHIDSALVSAQHRQRLYWVGRREEDGTYSQVHVEQPTDRGILLRDILETNEIWQDDNMVTEPVGETVDGKSFALRVGYVRQGVGPAKIEYTMKHHGHSKAAVPLKYDPPENCNVVVTDRNIWALTAGPSGVGGSARGYTVMLPDSKTNAMTAGHCKDSKVIEPLEAYGMRQTGRRVGEDDHRHDDDKSIPHWQRLEVNKDENKTNTLTTVQKDNMIAVATNSTNNVYTVRNGQIEIRGRKYPIKLRDGKYIIRKLTVRECMRLQTVPEWYDFSCVSNTQAYKMLGNGWTVEVIVHLIESIMEGEK
jgi:DNA (cytosine-5)-methyltransferase 3A